MTKSDTQTCTDIQMNTHMHAHTCVHTHEHAQTHKQFILVTVTGKLLTEQSLLKQAHVLYVI